MLVMPLPSSADARGISFSLLDEHLSLIGPIKDVHIAAIRPGKVRGNHFHRSRGELIALVYQDTCSVHWDMGLATQAQHRNFSGTGAVLIVPKVDWAHAIRNDGTEDLWIVAASDQPYIGSESGSAESDTVYRSVI